MTTQIEIAQGALDLFSLWKTDDRVAPRCFALRAQHAVRRVLIARDVDALDANIASRYGVLAVGADLDHRLRMFGLVVAGLIVFGMLVAVVMGVIVAVVVGVIVARVMGVIVTFVMCMIVAGMMCMVVAGMVRMIVTFVMCMVVAGMMGMIVTGVVGRLIRTVAGAPVAVMIAALAAVLVKLRAVVALRTFGGQRSGGLGARRFAATPDEPQWNDQACYDNKRLQFHRLLLLRSRDIATFLPSATGAQRVGNVGRTATRTPPNVACA